MIDWIDRNKKQPPAGKEVLAWGIVPTLPGYRESKFLGVTEFSGNDFNIDHTGHCGLVMVTHWAEINAPDV